jgi:hypothetical protein
MRNYKMKKLFFLTIIFILTINAFAQGIEFSPSSIGEMTAIVKVHGGGRISDLRVNQQVKLQVLTFQKTNYQEIEIIRENVFINGKALPANAVYDEFNNKYAEFVIPENGDFTYELIANVKTSTALHELTEYDLTTPIVVGGDYLEPSPKVESDSSEIITLVSNKFTKTSFIETLNDTIGWVNDYVEYASGTDFQKYYILQQSALETLNDRKGVCDEFSNLGAAILRAKGIPTRLAIGITFDGRDWGNHAWIEVYHPEIGWIPSDPTFRESGFVDATHIKMGSFSDVSLSLAKAIFPENASVSFAPPTLPEVSIIERNYFDKVELDGIAPTLKAKQWNPIVFTVKNKTAHPLTLPVTLNENYDELYVKTPRIDIHLNGNETKEVEFEIYPNIDLTPDKKAEGTGLRLSSLGTPLEIEFEIVFSDEEDEGSVEVIEIIPIVSGKNLDIESKIANYSDEISEVEMIVKLDEEIISQKTFDVNAFDFSKIIIQRINDFEEKTYLVEINTEWFKYTQQINPIKTMNGLIVEDQNKEQKIVQRVEPKNENTLPTIDLTLENPLVIILLVVILMIITITTTYYFSQKNEYI